MAACIGMLLVFLIVHCCASDLKMQLQASILVEVRQSFESYYDHSLDTWDASNYHLLCTSWPGVRCQNSTVVSLDLSNRGISGTLSPAITRLPGLLNLSLAGNSFSGEFPRDIHRLSKLRFLNASSNLFSGEPGRWDLSKLTELRMLDVYDNNFNGSLPDQGLADHLTHLDFGGNYLTGTIPPSYGSLRNLKYLSLQGNDLTGPIPPELGNLDNLDHLYLGYYNRYDGGIPPELGKLINLVRLDLANCSLQGPIPPELGNLQRLDTLFLHTNRLVGDIPPQLGNLTRIKSLDLSNNLLTGGIPDEFSGLRELTLLSLFLNRLHGAIPEFVAELPNLQVLKLWSNNFTGAIPAKLGGSGRLIELDLSSNKLTGLVPTTLCSGRRLRILILRVNFLLGPIPDDLGKCESLWRIRMGQNYLNGSIPAGLVYLPQLSLVELQSNYLSGPIPDQQAGGFHTKLELLNLSENQLSGSLPSSIGYLNSLQMLLLSGNKLSGEIPPQLGQLKSLISLDLSRNSLSGPIPPEIGSCPMLTYLDLSRNNLSGPIPTEITHIHILNYLNVSWNRLSRSLPKEIGSLKSLTSADFSHNNFSGPVPDFGQYTFFNSSSFLGNPELCGYLSKPCDYAPMQARTETGSRSQVPGRYKLLFAMGLLVCSLAFAVLAIVKARKLRRGSSDTAWKLTAFQKVEFRVEDILECIEEANIIGRGGAGVVYRGVMPDGQEVAVKKLLGGSKNQQGRSSHEDNGLSAEVQTLGKIRHRNIVRLLAFCSNKETNLLVYEYMSHGSLGEVLHGKSGGHLDWDTRLKIAIEAARGLRYLHHDCSPLIVHRDVKSNNILLSSDLEAHVADFGLAKFLQDNGANSYECMSAIAGSYGYIAPEYAYTLKVDEKSDVYSFGVVLLELVTGRRPVGDVGEERIDIVQWTKMQTNLVKETVVKILDPRLNEVPLRKAMQVFFVAVLCVQEKSTERPTMRDVVQMLAQAKQPNTFHMQ